MRTIKAHPSTIVPSCHRYKHQVAKSKLQMAETEIIKGQKIIKTAITQQQKQHSRRHRLMLMPIEQSDTMLLVSTTIYLNSLLLCLFIGRSLGQGTFGKVRLGTHLITQEKVAIKILEKDKIKD